MAWHMVRGCMGCMGAGVVLGCWGAVQGLKHKPCALAFVPKKWI